MIHGYGGYPDEGWRPWLRRELEKKGMKVSIPGMPHTNHPRVGPWTEMIRQTVGKPRHDDIFIGHSLGCIAIIRYLETLAEGESVGHCIFIAGFYEELSDEYAELRTFVDREINWNAVKARCPIFNVIHSDDDDAVPVKFAQDLADKLNVKLELHHGYGHFSGGDGITELPLILEHLV